MRMCVMLYLSSTACALSDGSLVVWLPCDIIGDYVVLNREIYQLDKILITYFSEIFDLIHQV